MAASKVMPELHPLKSGPNPPKRVASILAHSIHQARLRVGGTLTIALTFLLFHAIPHG
jgi:hypothetical protein